MTNFISKQQRTITIIVQQILTTQILTSNSSNSLKSLDVDDLLKSIDENDNDDNDDR